ncbi:PH domain-containing protein [Alloiococcus sp. CFN-8]|uniref:PH domain-containing protein n=1 Tax=Alloiococcus sp. CFN-8 TaxID=3416081 RepID=UPI003CFA96ED
MSAKQYIWKDRKRILGMPISFTKYSLTQDRLFCEVGLLSTKYDEVLLYRIRDIGLSRSFGQKLLGVGTIILQSSDKSTPVLELKNIKRAYEVKELLHQQVEEMKLARRVRVGEYMGEHSPIDDIDKDEDIEA